MREVWNDLNARRLGWYVYPLSGIALLLTIILTLGVCYKRRAKKTVEASLEEKTSLMRQAEYESV